MKPLYNIEIKEAYQKFSNISKKETKDILDEVTIFLDKYNYSENSKNKALKYLYFLTYPERYLLPRDYNRLVQDKNFSFIQNIYAFYPLEELTSLGEKMNLHDIVNLARNGSFEEQKNIQELYYLELKYLPKSIFAELNTNFFKTLWEIKYFVRKDVLVQTLKKSELTTLELEEEIDKLQKSNTLFDYKNTFTSMIQKVVDKYVLPTDYQLLIIDKSTSINYIMSNFYRVSEIEKFGKNISLDNMVDLLKKGTFLEQKSVEKLRGLDGKYIPIDFHIVLKNDFFQTIKMVDTFFKKEEIDKIFKDLNISKLESDNYKEALKKSNCSDYKKSIKKIKESILDKSLYSDNIKKYYDNCSIANLTQQDILLINFLKEKIKERRGTNLGYFLSSCFIFAGFFLYPPKYEWLLPSLSLVNSLLFMFMFNKINRFPKEFLGIMNSLPKKSRVFSSFLGMFSKLIVVINVLFILWIYLS